MGKGIQSLGYFTFEVSDLDAWHGFLTRVIGAERGSRPGGALVPYRFEGETGWGGRTVDDSTWETTTYDRISDWGHQSPYRRPPVRGRAMGEQR